MKLLFRERWPLLAGAVGALAVLAAFGLTGVGERTGERLWPPLALIPLVLTLFLLLQLLLNERISLRRERRLVDAAVQLREASARLQRLATTDALTGLFNRRVFDERLGVEFRRSQRYGRPLSLLMIDLDRFKRVNDEYGHPFGDFVLAGAARSISSNVRESDVVARYGGEELVVMLPETEREQALAVAEKLRAAVSARDFSRDRATVRMTISVGISALPAAGIRDDGDLLNRADEALYEAKRQGRDRVVVATPAPAPASAARPADR